MRIRKKSIRHRLKVVWQRVRGKDSIVEALRTRYNDPNRKLIDTIRKRIRDEAKVEYEKQPIIQKYNRAYDSFSFN